jgi:CHASE2 domain-containing sensor protein
MASGPGRGAATPHRSHALAVLLAGVVAIIAGVAVWSAHAAGSLEDATVGERFRLRPARPPSDLAVVAIDDATFSDLSPATWPYPRRWHGEVLDELRRLGARSVVFDVQFTEKTREADDWALYQAVGRLPRTVLATSVTDGHGHTNILGGDDNLARIGARPAMATFPTLAGGEIERMEHSRNGVPTIAVAAAQALGHRVAASSFEDGGAWIDYRGPPGTIPTVSYSKVYGAAHGQGTLDPRLIRGKTIVIGMAAPTLGDVHSTPVSTRDVMSGPEVQANAIWTVLHDLPLHTAPDWAALLAILALALAPPLAALRLRALAVATTPVLAALFLGSAQLAFDRGWVLPVIAPLTALVVSAVGTVSASYGAERRERRRVSRHNAALEEAVRERTAELHDTQLEVVARLARAAEWRDEDTGAHIERIGVLSYRLGLAAGMSQTEAETLRHAAVLHDVGKIGVPDRVLLKPGRLDPDEWEVMKAHAAIGASMLAGSPSPMVQLAEEIARTHHERWDGSGYPNGLRGTEIPLSGRICAVCDVFDALISRRPYKEAWPVADALAEIREQSGRHFDPELTTLFLEIVGDSGGLVAPGAAGSTSATGDDDPPVRLVA